MTSGSTENVREAWEAMRQKYREEFEKRLRPDGNEQYVEVAGKFARFVEDPFIDEPIQRDPRSIDAEALIVGGGFGGLLSAARLQEIGVTDVCVIEEGSDFGGTWYWNRYPGAQCDVESYIYLPLLEEVGTIPTEKYAHAEEIFEHSRAIGRHLGLYENALFQTRVESAEWVESAERWTVRTNHGDEIRVRYLILATGGLCRPKLPAIPGLGDFGGHAFHTSRWDYAYTGGSRAGNLDRLGDQRVALIGTGATAVQCVPHLGRDAEHLYVFQRTPSSVDWRRNEATDEEWFRSLEPGWQRKRMKNFTALVQGIPQPEDLVADGWTDLIRLIAESFRNRGNGATDDGLDPVDRATFEKMNDIRARVEELVQDPDTAEALKPYYRIGCKRPCFHDEYLQTFNRPNVTLVDTDGKGVERATEKGLVVNGREYEVDCIVFSTGFEVGTEFARRTGIELVGRSGQTLSEKWNDGLRTLHGITSAGFPNAFFVLGPQSTFAVNVPHALDEGARHVAALLARAKASGHTVIEPTPEAEAEWVQEIVENGTGPDSMNADPPCTPGYYNNEGQGWNPNTSFYGGGPVGYFRLLKKWRDESDFSGMRFDSGQRHPSAATK